MTSDITIEFKLTGPGWADVIFRFGERFFTITGVSYTTDGLGDLLRLALMLATGAWTARVSFDGEPMEWRVIAGNVWDDEPKRWREGFWVRVFTFADIYQHLPDEVGDLAFEIECEKDAFLKAILNAAKQFEAAYGIKQYEWGGNTFPLRAVRALEAAFTTADPPRPPLDPNATVITIYRPDTD